MKYGENFIKSLIVRILRKVVDFHGSSNLEESLIGHTGSDLSPRLEKAHHVARIFGKVFSFVADRIEEGQEDLEQIFLHDRVPETAPPVVGF